MCGCQFAYFLFYHLTLDEPPCIIHLVVVFFFVGSIVTAPAVINDVVTAPNSDTFDLLHSTGIRSTLAGLASIALDHSKRLVS